MKWYIAPIPVDLRAEVRAMRRAHLRALLLPMTGIPMVGDPKIPAGTKPAQWRSAQYGAAKRYG